MSNQPDSVDSPEQTPQHQMDTGEDVPVEEMSLQQKIAYMKNFKWQEQVEDGQFIDAMDTIQTWCIAKIENYNSQLYAPEINVHYDGWPVKWDRWLKLNSWLVAPFRRYSRGYTGQSRNASRQRTVFDIDVHRGVSLTNYQHAERVKTLIANELMGLSAWQTTQYIRGELFVYQDFLMHVSPPEEHREEALQFHYLMLDFVNSWLQKAAKLLHLQTHIRACPELYMADANVAILASYPEIKDILANLLASCARNLKYFMLFDREPRKDFARPVATYSKDAVVLNEEDEYDLDDCKEMINNKKIEYGQQVNFINYFAQIGGFDSILNLLKKGAEGEEKIDFDLLYSFTYPVLKGTYKVLDNSFAFDFVTEVAKHVKKRYEEISEKEIQLIDRDFPFTVLQNFVFFFNFTKKDELREFEIHEFVETTELMLSLKMLKSPYLEKRLVGLQQIKSFIDKINKDYISAQSTARHKAPKFVTKEYFHDWLLKNDVAGIVLSQKGTHAELIKRMPSILKFMKETQLPNEIVEKLWLCQVGKHEEVVRVVYDVVREIAQALNLEHLMILQSKIDSMARNQFDEKLLLFMEDFTASALQAFFHSENRKFQEKADSHFFEDHISKNQLQFALAIGKHKNDPNFGMQQGRPLFGLPVFWEISLDSFQIAAPLKKICQGALVKIMKEENAKPFILSYLLRSISQIQQNDSVVTSINISNTILSQFPSDNSSINEESQTELILPKLIAILDQEMQLRNVLFMAIQNYHDHVKGILKSLSDKGQPMPANPQKHVFLSSYSHEETLKALLDFLAYVLVQAKSQEVCFGEEGIKMLWKIFVQEPNFDIDQEIFLKWINQSSQGQSEESLFNEEEKKIFFFKIWCSPQYMTYEKATPLQVKCFHYFFTVVNVDLNVIKSKGIGTQAYAQGLQVDDLDKLQGLEHLWRITYEAPESKSREECAQLLVDMYLRQRKGNVRGILINKIMAELHQTDNAKQGEKVKALLQVVMKYLDRYELKRPGKNERFYQSNSITLQITNQTDKVRKSVQVQYFQSIGYLRQMIAQAFNFELTQFRIQIQKTVLDPDDWDEKLVKDVYNFPIFIYRDEEFDTTQNPKSIISGNKQYFEILFGLLAHENPVFVELTWDLLMRLPTNVQLQEEMRNLSTIEQSKENWKTLLDFSSDHSLLYTIRIINEIKANKEISGEWRKKFIRLDGFTHLLRCFLEMELHTIENSLSLKCLDNLIMLIYELQNQDNALQMEMCQLVEKITPRCLQFIHMVTVYVFKREQTRGESFESLQQKLNVKKQKKSKIKGYMNFYKKKVEEEEEEEDIAEAQIVRKLLQEFLEQKEVVFKLFYISHCFAHEKPVETFTGFFQLPALEEFLFYGYLRVENQEIRMQFHKDMQGLFKKIQGQQEGKMKIIKIMLLNLLPLAHENKQRAQHFLESLVSLIQNCDSESLQPLAGQVQDIADNLCNQILDSSTVEMSGEDLDQSLVGNLMILRALLQKFPLMKQPVGVKLIDFLLTEGLFEIPDPEDRKKGISKPKCKNEKTRSAALKLLQVLSRDVPANFSKVLKFMSDFIQDTPQRTKKESDWAIVPADKEKAASGYVGIFNPGCICYMISMFQQLFMIPSFRNDILSVNTSQSEESKEDNMLYQLQFLFANLLKSEKQYANPRGFARSFKDWDGNPTDVTVQMDVEEFYSIFMDRLEGKLKGTPSEKTVQNHFGGKTANEIIGKDCQHKQERLEPLVSISLPVKNKKSIFEGLETFIQGDELSGDNAWMCEKCDKKVDAVKRACIKRLPRFIFFTLRRFDFDFDKMMRLKVNDYYEFPHVLNMFDYTQEGLLKKEHPEKKPDVNYSEDYYNFDLRGIVVHAGTAEQGHYYSFIQDKNDNKKWYEFNDQNVRDFDVADIPAECFGGKETFIGQNMMQMTSEKWRNAYVLVYERRAAEVPEQENGEVVAEEKESSMSVDSKPHEENPVRTIEEQIQESNVKYWKSRFLFGQEFTEFSLDFMAGFTSDLQKEIALSYNNDFEILGERIPDEYRNKIMPLDNFDEPMFGQIPDSALLDVFKFSASFYLKIMQRSGSRGNIPRMINQLKVFINRDPECGRWLLQQFSHRDILFESVVENPQRDMRKVMCGLLYASMLSVYSSESAALNDFFVKKNSVPNTLAKFGLNLVANMFEAKKECPAYFNAYASLLVRFSQLGIESKEFLFRSKMLGRCLQFMFSTTPFKNLQETNEDVLFVENNWVPEIGLPQPAILSAFERRKFQNTHDCKPQDQYIMELYGILLCSLPNEIASPFTDHVRNQIVKPEVVDDEEYQFRMLQELQTIDILDKCTKKRAIKAIANGLAHVSYGKENSFFEQLLGSIKKAFETKESEKLLPFLYAMEVVVSQDLSKIQSEAVAKVRLSNFVMLMDLLMHSIKTQSQYWNVFVTLLDFLLKLATRYPHCRDWIQEQKDLRRIKEFVEQNKVPPAPTYRQQVNSLRFFRRNPSVNDINYYPQYINHYKPKYLAQGDWRIKTLAEIIAKKTPDYSKEPDCQIMDVLDYKFVIGQEVEQRAEMESYQTFRILEVLDELVNVQQNLDNSSPEWISCYSDKITPAGALSGTQRFQFIYAAQQKYAQYQPESNNFEDTNHNEEDMEDESDSQ